MTLTASQVRRACALLGWTSPMLAKRAQIGFDEVIKAKDDQDVAMLSQADVWAIRTALERAGVTFTLDAEGRPGAVLTMSP